jgi:ABC-type multidrug transport system fused ATPase/permease subunit
MRLLLVVLPTPDDAPHAVTPQISGRIHFDQVRFGYDARKPIIQDFSFTFEAGKTYALVGPSGSGKSTLIQLLLRFYDPQSGQVTLDETPLDQIQQRHFRKHVSAVMQDPIIFSTSVAENIAFAEADVRQATIRDAAEAAEADEFIQEFARSI